MSIASSVQWHTPFFAAYLGQIHVNNLSKKAVIPAAIKGPTGIPLTLFSVGPDREQTIQVRPAYA